MDCSLRYITVYCVVMLWQYQEDKRRSAEDDARSAAWQVENSLSYLGEWRFLVRPDDY
jgi:hypothetical protein